jgi:ADP-dependent NAD(P)H-hydrate dehydratase / NAD(P)H-hydrate epimerase
MKILPISLVREADAYTIEKEPIPSIELMERAANEVFRWMKKRIRKKNRVTIFCGTGNNGGDGLVVARLLYNEGCDVRVFIVRYSDNESEDFRLSMSRLRDAGWARIEDIHEGDALPELSGKDIVIDAIFGSGLSKPVTGLAAGVIRHINSSPSVVAAIDIPSGLFSDSHSDEKAGAILKADYTLSFQFPKLAFMFAENDQYVGEWEVLPIGLNKDFIQKVIVRDHLMTLAEISGQRLPRPKFSHKGSYGHALLIAGSYGKMGASVLASEACLRSGVGLLHTHIPRLGYPIIQTAVPEAMVTIDPHDEHLTSLPDLDAYTAIGVGPAIGFAAQTKNSLKLLIQTTPVPLLFDADAITILGENKTWLSFVPKNSIFTPHPKEFERITEKARDDFHRNQIQREFCIKYGVYVVLKGAHTCICGPDGVCYYNSTGNPGMGTGGSGDVLTGLILGLAAQKHTPLSACLLGTYIHGLAGDLAARRNGMEALIAGDIIDYIGKAFNQLRIKN